MAERGQLLFPVGTEEGWQGRLFSSPPNSSQLFCKLLGITFQLGPQATFILARETPALGPALLLIKAWCFDLIKGLPW